MQVRLRCVIGRMEGGYNERLIPIRSRLRMRTPPKTIAEGSEPEITGEADNILTNTTFTFENFARVFDGGEFWRVLGVTLFYTFFGTIGAIVLGLFSALLLGPGFPRQGDLSAG